MPTNPEHPTVLHALFGGTFDPIHYGHLRPVEALAAEVGLNRVTLLPNHVPPHRPQPEANAQQRLKMVELAIAGNPLFAVDDRELHRTTPPTPSRRWKRFVKSVAPPSRWRLSLVRTRC